MGELKDEYKPKGGRYDLHFVHLSEEKLQSQSLDEMRSKLDEMYKEAVIPVIIQCSDGNIWIYGLDKKGRTKLTQLDKVLYEELSFTGKLTKLAEPTPKIYEDITKNKGHIQPEQLYLSLFKIFWEGLKEGNIFSKFFLYVQNGVLDKEKKEKKISEIGLENECVCTRPEVHPVDDIKLDTLEICPIALVNEPDKKYTIYFRGQGEFYEDSIYRMKNEAERANQTVIGFNYRGVGESTGTPRSMDDLVKDGIAQVQRLLDLEVKPENITLSGWSLGGGVATLVAKHFHDEGAELKLFNDRSFSNLTNVVVGFVRTIGSGGEFGQNSGKKETWFGKALGFLLKPLVKGILGAAGWDTDIAAAYEALPAKNKCATNASDDPIILPYGSLRAGLENPGAQNVTIIQAKVDGSKLDSHNRSLKDMVSLDFYLISTDESSKNALDKKYNNPPDKLPALIQRGQEIYLYWLDPAKKETKLMSLDSALYKGLPFNNILDEPIKVTVSGEIYQDIESKMGSNISAEEKIYDTFIPTKKPVDAIPPTVTHSKVNKSQSGNRKHKEKQHVKANERHFGRFNGVRATTTMPEKVGEQPKPRLPLRP